MKTKHFLKLLICFGIIALYFASCSNKNFRMITNIDKNGSFQRTIFTEAESAFIDGDMSANPFLFDIDSCWQFIDIKTYGADNEWGMGKTKKVQFGINRKFQSFDEFNNLKFKEKMQPVANPEEIFNKKFKWFFTYYSFSTVYRQIFEVLPVPLENYLTENEQKSYLQGDLSNFKGWTGYEIHSEFEETGKKFAKFYHHNFYEFSFNAILHTVQNKNFMYASQMQEIKDSLFNLNWSNDGRHLVEHFYDIDDVIDMLDTFFKTSEFNDFYEKYDDDINSEYSNLSFDLNIFFIKIDYELILPGEIIETNAPIISGDTLKWKVDAYRILPSDFVITAQSRTANIWAFVVTFLLAAIAIYCLITVRKN